MVFCNFHLLLHIVHARFIHIKASQPISCHTDNWLSVSLSVHTLFLLFSAPGHQACFHWELQWLVLLLWILRILIYKCLCEHMSFVFLSIYPEMEFLGHILALCFTFWGTAKLFLKFDFSAYSSHAFLCSFCVGTFENVQKYYVCVHKLKAALGFTEYVLQYYRPFCKAEPYRHLQD